jgi:hypothetical protein
MEFIEAPAFTHYLSDYLNDEGYREIQARLGGNPELGDLMPGTAGSARRGGAIRVVAKAAGAGCGLSITTSSPSIRFG